jgi:hypothetical protein
MARDIGADQFIMSGLRVIGNGIITTNGGITATTEFTINGGGPVKTVRVGRDFGQEGIADSKETNQETQEPRKGILEKCGQQASFNSDPSAPSKAAFDARSKTDLLLIAPVCKRRSRRRCELLLVNRDGN